MEIVSEEGKSSHDTLHPSKKRHMQFTEAASSTITEFGGGTLTEEELIDSPSESITSPHHTFQMKDFFLDQCLTKDIYCNSPDISATVLTKEGHYSYRQHFQYLSTLPANTCPKESKTGADVGGECKLFMYLIQFSYIFCKFEVYYHSDGELQLACVTLDHSCVVAEERQAIFARTQDPQPLRPSGNGIKMFGKFAPERLSTFLKINLIYNI